MDLLGGYDTSSTTSSYQDDENADKDSITSSGTNESAAANTVNEKNRGPVALDRQQNEKEKTRDETKRRLLRLNSVLPLSRSMTKSSNGLKRRGADFDGDDSDGGAYSSNSSDFSDDESRIQSAVKRRRRDSLPSESSTSGGITNLRKGEDAGISSLLSDLMGIAPTTASSATCATTSDKKEELGMAFMTVKSTVVTRKKRKGTISTVRSSIKHSENMDDKGSSSTFGSRNKEVIDTISHGENHSDGIIVEDVHSEDDSENGRCETASTFKPRFKLQGEQSKPHTQRQATTISLPRHVIQGLRRGMDAAPIVKTSNSSTKIHHTEHQQQYHQHQQQLPIPLQSLPQTQTQTQTQTQHVSTKKSKRELERALRSGNFSSIDAATTTDITQAIYRPDHHQHESAPTHEQLLDISTIDGVDTRNFGKVARNLPAYIPQECGTSIEYSDKMAAKHRSKHQIHSLVTSAKALEAQRFRTGVMSGKRGGTGALKKGSLSRADAKKKYGW